MSRWTARRSVKRKVEQHLHELNDVFESKHMFDDIIDDENIETSVDFHVISDEKPNYNLSPLPSTSGLTNENNF